MAHAQRDSDKIITKQVHPYIYRVAIGLAAWLVLSIWGFIGAARVDYSLVVVSLFVLAAILLPSWLQWIWRKAGDRRALPPLRVSLRAWIAGELDTWQERLGGREATIQILLPLAAVAFGMTALAIVHHLSVAR